MQSDLPPDMNSRFCGRCHTSASYQLVEDRFQLVCQNCSAIIRSGSRPYDNQSLMPFGEFKNKKLVDVPASYLVRLYRTEQWLRHWYALHYYIIENLKALTVESQNETRDFFNQRHPEKTTEDSL